MKKTCSLIAFFVCMISYGQLKIGKTIDPILMDSGDFVQVEYLIKSKIEISGHITDKKIWFKADLDGIEIIDEKGVKYKRRKCDKDKCEILHLEILNEGIIFFPNFSRTN